MDPKLRMSAREALDHPVRLPFSLLILSALILSALLFLSRLLWTLSALLCSADM